jgi:uncharacterized protein YggE
MNTLLQKTLTVLAVILILFVGVKSWNEYVQGKYIGRNVRDTITVDGEGKVTATPDIARVDLGVYSEGTTVKATQEQNTKKMNAIVAALKDLKIDEKDIQTSQYTISPKYDYSLNQQRIAGYIVSQNVTVKVRDTDSVGTVLGKAGELGANTVGGVQFTIDDPKALEAEARAKAIEDARTKAQALARDLGLTVVKVVTFSEAGRGGVPMPYAAKAYDMMAQNAVSAPTPDVQTGSLDITSNVSVTFEIR